MNAVRRKPPPALGDEVRWLLQALPLPAAILDADGKVLHANEAMRERAGPSDPTLLPGAHVTASPLGHCVFLLPQAAPDPQMQRLASLGFMLAGVSHEVSNPLAAIHSMVQILQSPRCVTPETLEKGLESIAGSVVRVLAITRKLGNFSRSAGDAPEPQTLDAAVSEALALLRHNRLGDAVEVSYDGMPEAVTRAPRASCSRCSSTYSLTPPRPWKAWGASRYASSARVRVNCGYACATRGLASPSMRCRACSSRS